MQIRNEKFTLSDNSRESAVESKKIKHKKSILSFLYFKDKKSIAELSEALFISIPTLTSYIEELLSENWIFGQEVDTKKQGRNPTIYSLDANHKFNIIVDITTHSTKVVILNFKNEINFEQNYNLGLSRTEEFIDKLKEIIDSIINEHQSIHKEIISIGITSPGLIHEITGHNKTYTGFNTDSDSISEYFLEKWGIPVHILNDTKATVYGESIFGVGKDQEHLLSINVDWGVGLAVIINGQIFNGASGFAGELGHIQMNSEGELCTCGKVGCLDTVASASALLKNVKKGLVEGSVSSLTKYKQNLEDITLETVIEAARNGDGFAIDTLYNVGIELGRGLSVAVHLFNPRLIVIDGVLSKAGNLIVNPVEFAINKYCLPDFKEGLDIKVTELGNSAKLLGMNAFVAKRIFKNE